MTRFLLIFVFLGAALGLSACNTVRGVGQDIQKTGQVIEGAVKK